MRLFQLARIPKGHFEYNPSRLLRVGRWVFWVTTEVSSTEVAESYGEWKTLSFGVTTHINVDLAEEHMDAGKTTL